MLALRGFAVFALGLETFFGPGVFLVTGFAAAGFSAFSTFSTGAGFLVGAFFVLVVVDFCVETG